MKELDEIKARLGGLLELLAFPETPEERDSAESEITANVARLTAAVEAVLVVCDGMTSKSYLADVIRTAIENALKP